ncbi:MAG: metallophosphoesterase [Bacteroidota bacterium]
MRNSLFLLCCLLVLGNVLIAQSDQLRIEKPKGAQPWSSLDIKDDPGKFQFAIVTDRTGGHRPGVFMDGIRKVNLLQPAFVMSVGDLIEGYTEDLPELQRQWEEFDGFIDSLDMPFFYVPGNHDITNKVMEQLYMERYGKTQYHFVYKDVLFLCLNTEDQCRGAGRGSISDDQYNYIEKTLADNTNVKWTLVFMHQPLWTQENPERWPDVEKLLATRKHSVFTGHVHHYVKFNRNNGKYFTLGTTGGATPLRGAALGEFDHVTWVTMTDNGPIMANLQLDGIWDENVSTEATRDYALDVLDDNCIRINPLFIDEPQFEEGLVEIKLVNDKDLPMKVRLKEAFSWDLKGELDQKNIEVNPNSETTVQLLLQSKKYAQPISDLRYMRLNAKVRYEGEAIPNMAIPFTFHIGPEPKYPLKKTEATITIDGVISEWGDLPYLLEGETTKDSKIAARFGLSYDEEYLYVGARVYDEDIQTDTSAAVWNQDYVGLVFNADPLQRSAQDSGEGWYRHSMLLLLAPATATLPGTNNLQKFGMEDLKGHCKTMPGGYAMELAIPLRYVVERQGEDWKSIRINMIVQDQDKGLIDLPRYLFKPDWRGKENRVGSGMFFRQ